jgi:peptidoglycan/LPS O-acetylase OafA/YrhL/lysophospholipase L1-like esterase
MVVMTRMLTLTRVSGTRPEQPGGSGYLPSLDGIRGVAVLLVFAFHAGYGWATGGFLGVSVFFTLSGFLITSLVLRESVRTRTVDLGRFWARRLRRLLPAALATLVFVLVLSATVLRPDPATFRADVLASLFNLANWHFLVEGNSYSSLFQEPSPVRHFWSLAIEEQFYLLFPLTVWGVLRLRSHGSRRRMRSPRSTIRAIALVGIAGSIVASALAARSGDFDFLYYSLPTRAGEILIGALLATFAGVQQLRGQRSPWWLTVSGVAALVAIVALCAGSTVDSSWIADGGLLLFGLLSATLVATALARGPLAAVLALAPLRLLGRISYGVYLYHWPVILWLTPERVGVRGDALVAIQLAVTLAIATASFVLLEQPIRRGYVFEGGAARLAVPVGIALLVVTTLVMTSTYVPAPGVIDFEAAQRELRERSVAPPAPPEAVDVAPRVGFFGDSTALIQTLGMGDWARASGVTLVGGSSGLGCGIGRAGLVRNPFDHRITPARLECQDWGVAWQQSLDAEAPDVAVVQVGAFDIADRRLPGDATFRAPGDPVYDEHLRAEMLAVVDFFAERGVHVVWLTAPAIDVDRAKVPAPPAPSPESDPARIARFNELLREAAAARPELAIVDLAGWLRRRPGGELDPALRPDGAHFTVQTAAEIAPWLGPAILRAARAKMSDRASG